MSLTVVGTSTATCSSVRCGIRKPPLRRRSQAFRGRPVVAGGSLSSGTGFIGVSRYGWGASRMAMCAARRGVVVGLLLGLVWHQSAEATTVILMARTKGFILAADSRQTITQIGGLLGMPRTTFSDAGCKVVVSGSSGAFASAGTVALVGFDVMALARHAWSTTTSPKEAMATLSRHIDSTLGQAAARFYREQILPRPLDPVEVVSIGIDEGGAVAVYQMWEMEQNLSRLYLGGTVRLTTAGPKEIRLPANPEEEHVLFVGQRSHISKALRAENAEALRDLANPAKRFSVSEAQAVRLINIEAGGSSTVGGQVDVLTLSSDGKVAWHAVKETCRQGVSPSPGAR